MFFGCVNEPADLRIQGGRKLADSFKPSCDRHRHIEWSVVTASQYVLFAVMGGSARAQVLESAPAA